MRNKSVIVLDIRTNSITASIGEAGVNNTFIFKGTGTDKYSGCYDGKFNEEADVKDKIKKILDEACRSANKHYRSILVGVPGHFTLLEKVDVPMSFSARKKINRSDIEAMKEKGKKDIEKTDYRLIHASALYYNTGDSCKVIDPIGTVTAFLQGKISYIFVSNYFCNFMQSVLEEYGFKDIKFVPSSYAQGCYLLKKEEREKGAIMLDIGTTQTTLTVFSGNGIEEEETYDLCGEVNIYFNLNAQFGWKDTIIEAELKKANLNRIVDEKFLMPLKYEGVEENTYPVYLFNQTIVDGIHDFYKPIGDFLDLRCPASVANRPIQVTGDGIADIKGAIDELSNALTRNIEKITPRLPYVSKTLKNSTVSLLAYALQEQNSFSLLDKILSVFGG